MSERLVPRVLADEAELGQVAAELICGGLARAGRAYVLGCPAGRSPRSAYAGLAARAKAEGLDLAKLHLMMMDEFVEASDGSWRLCPEDAHYSCRGFGERKIRRRLNAGRAPVRQVPRENLHWPAPGDPEAYERLIQALGGVDLFLLASGSSDGHVAFNPPGTPLEARTQVVRLAETTRADNLATFPGFADLADVPAWGVTISPGTIMRLSRSALLLLPGAAKANALKHVLRGYDPDWPASVIHLCRDAVILTDVAAWQAMESV